MTKKPTEQDIRDLEYLASKGYVFDTGKRKDGRVVWGIASGKTEAHLDHALMVRDAISELAAEGLIYDSGQRRRGQIVWVATPGTKEFEEQARLAESKGKK